ncbi:STAS domain-containing protein [Saccharothrix luteola]|uniref:STAS domain-containing protein n=1 Tax=Saccharothrix luteola TaxID=2893018 RepID=UPI001E318564|nr:STAS domain-containing protein [Saccharothrix luteola]MCC8242685.1 STAS domain-containing protein [Saccharothrix luteola]
MKIDNTAGGAVPEPGGGAVRVLGQGDHVEPAVTVRTTDHDGCPVTAVAGEIDSHSVTPVEVELSAQLDRRPGALVLDLNAVGFMASAGVTMLLNAHHHAAANGVSLAVVARGSRSSEPGGIEGWGVVRS